MSTEELLVEVRHVSQVYRTGNREFTAIEDVNLTLRSGQFVSLLGPSGSGKSTLLRAITGLQPPSTGTVLYRGVPVTGVNRRSSMVFQTFALFPWLTVQANVEVALSAQGVPSQVRTERTLRLLDMVGLDGFETAYPRELSGGMRQKVGFARAMAVEPELLCLDEPFSALDVLSAEALRGELLELWLGGQMPTQAILMVTHNIEEAVLMSDRILVMEKDPGRIVSEMTVTLPRPRMRKDPQFMRLVDRVYAILAGQTQPEALELGSAPGEPGRTRALPAAEANELAGLLEHVDEMPDNRTDIYRLADDLGIDSDRLLLLTDMAELLGFATIARGDIELTPLGESFAEASILARKEIFATRIRRLPVFRWLLTLLRASDRRQLEWDVVVAALELEFPPEEAERQLETSIGWGRYAELIAYDDSEKIIYLEQSAESVVARG